MGDARNWETLGVYVVVMLLVARVVASLESARSEALRRTAEARRLFDLSEMLVQDRSVDDLLRSIVGTVGAVFAVPSVALLVPEDGRLEIAAAAGDPSPASSPTRRRRRPGPRPRRRAWTG